MAVLFGLLIVFAIVACCTAISRRFPRTTATFTLLLWLMTAIFFILGSGSHLLQEFLSSTAQNSEGSLSVLLQGGDTHVQ